MALTRGSQRTKISVGSNPWAPRPRTHNIAKICERYGGGGHAVVGAISLKPEEVELGRAGDARDRGGTFSELVGSEQWGWAASRAMS